MKIKSQILFNIYVILILISVCSAQKIPLTTAESSNFESTSRYDDIIDFINELQSQSPLIRLETIATTTEGRDIPMIILGDPPPSSPLDLKRDDRMVVYLQGNIHGGEVEGKEGLQILAREIVLEKDPLYLDRLIILIVPVFNPDGNEKISTKNRQRQAGPLNGVGARPNGQNLDLNRDGLKLETPEVRGLVKNVMLRWDPLVLLDSHTHNGSYHEEPVTFVWSLNPNGDTSLVRYANNKMYQEITDNLRNNYDILCIPHGDFLDVRDPEKGWIPLGPQPRYLSNYFGLRNRIGILNENYPYADFETRINGCYKLFRALLDFCYQHKDEITQLIQSADHRNIQRGLNPTNLDEFAINYDVRSTGQEITVRGWEMLVEENPDRQWPKVTKTDTRKTYKIPFLAEYYPKNSVRLPFAYLFDDRLLEIADKLRDHGIVVEKITEPAELDVETFIIDEVTSENSLNQGHYQSKISGTYKMTTKIFPEGTFFVTTSQPLSNVVSYLLEPESDDGLVRWNFFDRYIVKQWSRSPLPYLVYKLYNPANIAKIAEN
jgi:hypothetical protein